MLEDIKPTRTAKDAHWLYVEGYHSFRMIRKEALFIHDLNEVAKEIKAKLPFKVGMRDFKELMENGEVKILYSEDFYIKLYLKGLKYKDALKEK